MPVPGDISAAFYSLADALNVMRREGEGGIPSGNGVPDLGAAFHSGGAAASVHGDDLLAQMIQTLLSEAETPPKEIEGVSEEFCDGMCYSFFFPSLWKTAWWHAICYLPWWGLNTDAD